MQSSVIDFDPYQAWLQIPESSRPPNAYQLLGLKELEADTSRIRSAIVRQTLAMDRCRTDADERTWQLVNEELAAAIRTLLDPELKAVLDGGLRRSASSRSTESAGRAAAAETQGTLLCSCGIPNATHRKFCSSCGQSLWAKCPQCSAECSCDERFCGHCGLDIRSSVEQRHSEYRVVLEEAQSLAANHHYERALSLLRGLAATDDKRFEHWAQLALAQINRTEQELSAAKSYAEKSVLTARRLLSEFAYDQAADELARIPEPLRTDESRDLHRQALASVSELATLKASIRRAVSQKSLWNLLPQILRLLTLKPNDAPVHKLALQLRDHFVRLAKAKIANHEYAEATKALQQIAPFARTEEVESLADKAQELDCLMQSLHVTAVADSSAIALSRKLAKYAPSNPSAKKLLAELEERAKALPADPRLAAPNGALPAKPHLGMPADWLGHFTKMPSANAEITTRLREHPGEFFVALGLALQGLDEAHCPINLLPPEKNGVLGRLNLGRLRAKTTSAWGLDLGTFGLKALKLCRDPQTGRTCIEACEYIPHASPLTAPSAELDRGSIVEQTLRTFLERAKTDGGKVAVNIPGQRVLGRFFDLPPLPAAKLADAIQFEAKHQLPIPLEELCWGYQLLSQGGVEAASRGANVVVAAVRQSHVRDCLAPFKNVGIGVDIVQSDCLALHNALHREFFASAADEGGAGASINEPEAPIAQGDQDVLAFIEIGAEGSNVVFTSRNTVWFRSFGLAGNSFTNALVRQLQLTHEQAEHMKREPARARRYHELHNVLQPLFAQLSSEVERSVASYLKLYPNHRIRHVYGLGGAFPTHGLLRQLRFGR